MTALAAIPITSRNPFLASSAGLNSVSGRQSQSQSQTSGEGSCWLDVCAPFIVEDPGRGLQSEIILTSDTFVGSRGYTDGRDATEYEFYLYDADGRGIGPKGLASRLKVPAMHTSVIPVRDLIAPRTTFWGGMTIRLRPIGRQPMHASDLFSSAFVRWQTNNSFDNVHANPDPLQWQKLSSFYYSMAFPPLSDYECTFGIFNPYADRSAGLITLRDYLGRKLIKTPYALEPRTSLLFSLNQARFGRDAGETFALNANGGFAMSATAESRPSRRAPGSTESEQINARTKPLTEGGGTLAITNNEATMKCFGYLIIKKSGRDRFSVEHPIHQPISKPLPSATPFDDEGQFKAKNVLFSPLLFRATRIGSITLESRFLLTTGLPYREALWFAPYAVDSSGSVVWVAAQDKKLASQLTGNQLERGAIRLASEESALLDFSRLSLRDNFSGGLCLPIAPESTHTLMKVEARVPEWGAHAFTHFRPGLRAARAYQAPKQRGGLATDYVTSGARLGRRGSEVLFDEFIGVINIDDQGIEGRPTLELFGAKGLMKRIALAPVPGFGCCHFLLSDLIKDSSSEALTMRLIDEQATLLMSTVHLDYQRRDIALDHGSDRFSTFTDYSCGSD
jgi:hypothetical protein